MNSKATCQTVLLSDTPEKSDLFNGAHEKLANAILNLIETEAGGKTIGLEGEWGSGKSTVINLLKNKLIENEESEVVLFDAWAHQGDPLRRSFLETITKHLIHRKWVNPEKWQMELDILSKKKQTTTTNSSPQLTPFGIAIILSFLLVVPIGVALLNAAIRAPGYISFSGGSFVVSLLAAGILFTTSPVILYFLGYVLAIVCKPSQRLPIIGKYIKCNFSLTGALLVQKYDTTVTTSTYLSPEPTSLEFGDKFEQLIKEAISNSPKKLIVVLDNLDRIDANNALSILTTLQTFLQHDIRERSEYTGLWVVIPYDLRGLAKIWNQSSDASDQVTISMLSKRFQIRFTVPPLLLSDWRDYVITQLKIALPSHDTAEDLKDFDATYLIYRDIITKEKRAAPSPRDIKVFINQIGAIHRQWGDTFPISHIAYYVLSILINKEFQDKLRNKELLHFDTFFSHDENILANLAAMYFNVNKELAFQLLLQAHIETALFGKDPDAIIKFEEMHGKGFWATLENMNFEQYAEQELSNAGVTLEQSKVFSRDGSQSQKEQILRSISSSTKNITNLASFNVDLANGFIAIAKLVDRPEIIADTINLLSTSSTNQSLESITMWTQGVATILGDNWVVDKNVQLPERVVIPGDPEMLFFACLSLYGMKQGPELWKRFTTQLNAAEFIQLFTTKVTEGMTNNYRKCLKVAMEVAEKGKWSSLGKEILNKLKVFVNYENEELEALLRSLYYLKDKGFVSVEQFDELKTGGQLYHYLFIAQSKNPIDAGIIGLISYTLLNGQILTGEPAPNGNAVNGYNYLLSNVFQAPSDEVASSINNLIPAANKIAFLMSLPKEAKSLKKKLADIIIEKNFDLFSPDVVSTNWSEIADFYSDELNIFIEKTSKGNEIISHIVGGEFNVENANLYSLLVSAENFKEDDQFANWLQISLQNIDKEIWEQQLNSQGNLTELVINIVINMPTTKLNLGIAYQDALFSHAEKTMTGELTPTRLGEIWKNLPNALSDSRRDTFRLKLIRRAKDAGGAINDDFFKCYSAEISDPITLSNDAEVVLLLFSPLVEKSNIAGLRWMENFIATNPTFLDNYKIDSTVEELKERINSTLKEEGIQEDIKDILSKIEKSIDRHKKSI